MHDCCPSSFTAELSGLLFIGDAILQVHILPLFCMCNQNINSIHRMLGETIIFLSLQINGINVRKCRHEEVVSFLYFFLMS